MEQRRSDGHRLAGLGCALSALLGCADPSRVVIFGLDGLDRTQLEHMIGAGELPNFARVMREGSVNDLATTRPILSPIIWTSIASGYPGEVHGVAGWTTQEGRPYTSADARTWRLWDIASAHDVQVLVSGWLMSWPATPVPGAMLTDRFVWAFPMNKDPTDPSVAISRRDQQTMSDLIWPPEAQDDARALVPGADDLQTPYLAPLAYQLDSYGGPFHPVTRDETQLRFFESRWSRDGEARLGMVYMVGADQVSHLYWPFVDEAARRAMRQDPTSRMRAASVDQGRATGRRAYPLADRALSAEMIEEGARWVPDYYRYLDTALGRVIDVIDPTTTTLFVASDHGFQRARGNPVLNGGHKDPAVLIAWGAHVLPGGTADASVLDITPTTLALLGLPAADDMPGHALTGLVDVTPVKSVASWVLPRVVVEPDASPDDPASQRMLEQLEALGYVDAQRAPVLGASRGAAKRKRAAGGH